MNQTAPVLESHEHSAESRLELILRVMFFVGRRLVQAETLALGPDNTRKDEDLRKQLSSRFKHWNQIFGVSFFDPTSLETSLDLTGLVRRCAKTEDLDLGEIYLEFLRHETAKQGGVFYTPREIAKKIVVDASTVKAKSDGFGQSPPHSLDPACGCGVFLVSLLRELVVKYKFSARTVLEHYLYGIDLDHAALDLCRVNLLLTVNELEPSPIETLCELKTNLARGNFLFGPEDLEVTNAAHRSEPEPLSIFEVFPAIADQGGFDMILGNPPYGLSRNEQLSPSENRILKLRYAATRRGKVNKYLLFMARAYELLAAKGVVSLLVPNAWLGIEGGANVRRLLVEDRALSKISVFRYPVFGKLGVEVVSFLAQKGSPRDSFTIEFLKSSAIVESQVAVPHLSIHKDPNFQISTTWTPKLGAVLDQIFERSRPLAASESSFAPTIALQAYSLGKGTPPQTKTDVKNHVFHTTSPAPDSLPYLEGRDIARYSIDHSGKYLRYGPWLSEFNSRHRYAEPRVVVREITASLPYLLIATYLDLPYFYNRSALHIHCKVSTPEGERPKLLLTLCGILNSRFASAYLKLRGRKCQRSLFPKIVNADLKAFPIPLELPIEQLAPLVRTLLHEVEQIPHTHRRAIWKFSDSSSSIGTTSRIREIQSEIDRQVYQSFGLNAAMVNTLEDLLQRN